MILSVSKTCGTFLLAGGVNEAFIVGKLAERVAPPAGAGGAAIAVGVSGLPVVGRVAQR